MHQRQIILLNSKSKNKFLINYKNNKNIVNSKNMFQQRLKTSFYLEKIMFFKKNTGAYNIYFIYTYIL